MPTFFELDKSVLQGLDQHYAVKVFGRLLRADARRMSIPLGKVHISEDVNTADGGIDARVDAHDSVREEGAILKGQTRYQIKTGEAFRPWQQAAIRNELFDKADHPAKENLAPGVRACMEEGGTYVLVCFGHDLVDKNQSEAKKHLREFLQNCGYTEPKVEVWGAGNLKGFIEQYDSLTIDVARRSEPGLKSRESWGRDDEMNRHLQLGNVQTATIEEIRKSLRAAKAQHIRVCGEPGSGKTRLVFEATGAVDLESSVVYWEDAQRFLASQQFSTISTSEVPYTAILVVDECDFESSCRIWNALRSRADDIRLITIDHEFHAPASPDVVYPTIPKLGEDDIAAIITSYGVPVDVARKYGGLCSGSPRVAHMVGENLTQDSPDLLALRPTMGDVWNRVVNGRDLASSERAQHRRVALMHMALFKRFGFKKPVEQEGIKIAGLVSQAEPRITLLKFSEIVGVLRERRILQGETTLYITPKLFHIWLWTEWWRSYGNFFNVTDFAENLSPKLFEWFGEMFRYARDSEAAAKQVKELLGPEGPFGDEIFVASEIGGRFFLSLAEADPPEALRCLERTIGTWHREELIRFTEGRRQIIYALERIAFWSELFPRAARLLLALAEAENENWANNASGVFAGLFSLAPGEVAPTGASPAERFPILIEALHSLSKKRRLLGLRACKEAIDTHGRICRVRSELSGLRLDREPWTPTSRDEIINAYKFLWKTLEAARTELPEEDERAGAIEVTVEEGLGLLEFPDLGGIVLDSIERLVDEEPASRKPITKGIIHLLRFGADSLGDETVGRLKALNERLAGADFSSALRRYVGMMDWEDQADEKEDQSARRERLGSLARDLLDRPDLLREESPWLLSQEAENAFAFGLELAKLDTGHALLQGIVDLYRSSGPESFLGLLSGYLKGMFERNLRAWEATLDSMAEEVGLARRIPEATWRSGLTDQAALRVLDLIGRGVCSPLELRFWSYGVDIRVISPEIHSRWIEILLERGGPGGASVALDLFQKYYCYDESIHPLPSGQAKCLLLSNAVFRGDLGGSMTEYYWAEVARRLTAASPDDALDLLEGVLSRWDSYGVRPTRSAERAFKVLYGIIERRPPESWARIKPLLGDLKSPRAALILEWLQGRHDFFASPSFSALTHLPKDDLWAWVDEDFPARAEFLARYVPKTLEGGLGELTRQLLTRYGKEVEVRRSLFANFSTEGWVGEASAHYQEQRDRLLATRRVQRDENVTLWIDEYTEILNSRIEDAKVREERKRFE